jgi:hypothetical protein
LDLYYKITFLLFCVTNCPAVTLALGPSSFKIHHCNSIPEGEVRDMPTKSDFAFVCSHSFIVSTIIETMGLWLQSQVSFIPFSVEYLLHNLYMIVVLEMKTGSEKM